MPSTLVHSRWLQQLAVRWFTQPLVDVLERGAYTCTRVGTMDAGWIHRDHSSVEGFTTLTCLWVRCPLVRIALARGGCLSVICALPISLSCALSNSQASPHTTCRLEIVSFVGGEKGSSSM
ncbi:hypothetical protein B0H13DRAFT_2366409 [Mycena leptocephala]|nr:hypothetical protein B0H13DRAFT_2366409 [Mycena leptocephala]